METAQRLLAHEDGADEHPATAAARAYEKIHDRLAPLIGSAGVRALFLRSQKMARLAGFVLLEGGAADSAANPGRQLHDNLHGQERTQAAETATVVMATFLGLLTTLIGDSSLGHQILFANASPERKALYFNVLGEPPIKMLRYQQQFSFFDTSKVNESIRFIHLGEEAQAAGLAKVYASIVREVEKSGPSIVVVDSFRGVLRRTLAQPEGESDIQSFIQRLALHLTSCEATTFLLGEYAEEDNGDDGNSIFTVADVILWLYQSLDRNSMVRKLQVSKIRGQGPVRGFFEQHFRAGLREPVSRAFL